MPGTAGKLPATTGKVPVTSGKLPGAAAGKALGAAGMSAGKALGTAGNVARPSAISAQTAAPVQKSSALTHAPKGVAAGERLPLTTADQLRGKNGTLANQANQGATSQLQDIPQFEEIGSIGQYVIGLREAVEQFAVAHNRRGPRDMRDISKTFEEADSWFKEEIENGNYPKPYEEIWLDASKNIGRSNVSLKRYVYPDSPLQPLFELREQQLQHALNPDAVARPIDQRYVLLDETSVRVAEEIKSLAENLNIHDPLRADIQRALGGVEENATGSSSSAFLDISHQLPKLEDKVAQYSEEHGRNVWGDIQSFREAFKRADEKVFVIQGNKVYANPNLPKGTSYVEMWKRAVDGRSIRGYMSEGTLQEAFELRQQQLDYLLSQGGNFLVNPSVGNGATARTAQEIQDKLSGLPENNPLRKYMEDNVNLKKYAQIGQ